MKVKRAIGVTVVTSAVVGGVVAGGLYLTQDSSTGAIVPPEPPANLQIEAKPDAKHTKDGNTSTDAVINSGSIDTGI